MEYVLHKNIFETTHTQKKCRDSKAESKRKERERLWTPITGHDTNLPLKRERLFLFNF